MTDPIIILIALFIKHYLADFQWQTPFMYLNKGKWGHLGGIFHSGVHVGLTLLIIGIWNIYFGDTVLSTTFLLLVVLFEFIVHYVTDLTKVKLCAKLGWSKMCKDSEGEKCLSIYSDKYFLAFGIDQTIHSLTYIAIVFYII